MESRWSSHIDRRILNREIINTSAEPCVDAPPVVVVAAVAAVVVVVMVSGGGGAPPIAPFILPMGGDGDCPDCPPWFAEVSS